MLLGPSDIGQFACMCKWLQCCGSNAVAWVHHFIYLNFIITSFRQLV